MPAGLAVQRDRDKLQRMRAKVARKERSVLLRAKLITLRARRRVETVTVPAQPEVRHEP